MIYLTQSETSASAEMPQTPLQPSGLNVLQHKKSFDDDHKYIINSPTSKSFAYNPTIALGPKLNINDTFPFDNSPSCSFSAAHPPKLQKFSTNSYLPDTDLETPIPPSLINKIKNKTRITLNCQETFPFDASPSISAKRRSSKIPKIMCLADNASADSASCIETVTPIAPPSQHNESPYSINSNASASGSGSSPEESSDFSMFGFLEKMEECDEDIVLIENGYEKVKKICDTLQGELILAVSDNAKYA